MAHSFLDNQAELHRRPDSLHMQTYCTHTV